MKLLMVYNFSIEEAHVVAPNFYKACAEKVFPGFGVETTFLPNLRTSLLFNFLKLFQIKSRSALTIAVAWWLLKNGHKFDVIMGWSTYGVIAAIIKKIIGWDKTSVCLILYKLPENKGQYFGRVLKKIVISKASLGAELLLSLDASQAKIFESLLNRKPGTTYPLVYGVDIDWYENLQRDFMKKTPIAIFCPGNAHRDDATLIKSISELEVYVKRFKLCNDIPPRSKLEKIGKAYIEDNINAPYSKYLADCLSSLVTVIAVENEDKPVGLTSLLECMALGRPIIMTKGVSTHDYIQDGVTGLLYEKGNWKELQDKIIYLLEQPRVALEIGAAAREAAKMNFELNRCGKLFYKYLNDMKMKNV